MNTSVAQRISAGPAGPAAIAAVPVRRPRSPAGALLASAGLPLAGLGFTESYRLAYHGTGTADEVAAVHALFWIAVGVGLASVAGVWALSARRRRTAAILAAALGGLLSAPKILRAPFYFSFYDEQAHVRATQSLLEGGGLLAANPLNRVVADYPGLHLVTAVLTSATGGSVFAAGTVLIALARVAGCLAVYLIAARLVRSPGTALLAVAVFVANPAFMFFDAQFSYESLAAPLVATVIALALGPVRTDGGAAIVTAAFLTVFVAVTHHGSSYLLAAVLVLVLLADRRSWRKPGPIVLAVLGLAAPTVWLGTVARTTLTYVTPYVRSNVGAIPGFLKGTDRPRRLFGGFLPLPWYERAASYAAVLVLFALFCWGAWLLLRRRPPATADARHRAGGTVVLAALGAVYFASLPLVALRGDQVVKRLWEFAFIGVGVLCAPALVALLNRSGRFSRSSRLRQVGAAGLVVVVFIGSGVARSGEHIRFPGPYLPSADPRSMTPDVVAAAQWLRAARGPGFRVAGDRTLAAVLGSYGEQTPVTYQEDGVPVWAIFEPDDVTPAVRQEIRRARLDWLATDRRTAGRFPLTGFYFDESEPGAYVDPRLTDRGLAKFDGTPFTRAYDNGNIVLYEVMA